MRDIYEQYEDFKKLEILFKGSDDEIYKVVGKVRYIESTNITVYASLKRNADIEIPEGSKVKIYVYTDNGVYNSDSTVIYAEKDDEKIIYTLTYPVNNRHSQRREFFRADMNVSISVKIVRDILSGVSDTIHTHSRDVCGNGISFFTDEKITNYEDILVSIDLGEKVIETSAKLIYSRPITIRNKEIFINALKFTNISRKDIDFIVKKCFLYQLRLKNME